MPGLILSIINITLSKSRYNLMKVSSGGESRLQSNSYAYGNEFSILASAVTKRDMRIQQVALP